MNPIDENTLKQCNNCASKGLTYSQKDGRPQVMISEDYMSEARNGMSYLQQASILAEMMANSESGPEFKQAETIIPESALTEPNSFSDRESTYELPPTNSAAIDRPEPLRSVTEQSTSLPQPERQRNYTSGNLFGSEVLGNGIASPVGEQLANSGSLADFPPVNPNQIVRGQVLARAPSLTSFRQVPSLALQGLRNTTVFGKINNNAASVDCDGYSYKWLYWLADPWLYALGYRLFQTVTILQTFECCEQYLTHFVYGYFEVLGPPTGYDRQQTTGIGKDGHNICFFDNRCDNNNHGGLRRITESRIVKSFLARPTQAALKALASSTTAFVELAGQLKTLGIGQLGNPDCVQYWSQAQANDFVLVGFKIDDLVLAHSALKGSERDAAVMYTAEFDCGKPSISQRPCISSRLAVTSKLDPSFRLTLP